MALLFGAPLITALARSSFTTPSGLSIPGILARIFEELQAKGLDVEGIFRKSGSTAIVNQLQAQFEATKNPFLVKFPETVSIHSLAGLFKRYLQQLPEPVIPRQFQPVFLNIFDEEKCTKETLKRRLKEACKSLPHEHLHLFQFLMQVADIIQQKQGKNQMSIESLAIILAPTCVRIDAVSKLMPSASTNMYAAPVCTSYNSLPVMNKNQLIRKASKIIWSTLRKKKQNQKDRIAYDPSSILYKPNELLQLELVKESNIWIKIFRFMMSYPEVFTTLTNPIKKYQPRPVETKKIEPSPTKWDTSFTPQEKKLLFDFKPLEFTDDLIKTFGSFDLNLDLQQQPKKHQQQPSKYIETLLNWKSREEENPHVIVPHTSSPSAPDWVKLALFTAEPNTS